MQRLSTHDFEVCLLEFPGSLLQAFGDHRQLCVLPLQVLNLLLCFREAAPALDNRRIDLKILFSLPLHPCLKLALGMSEVAEVPWSRGP